jgi:hypothetical protein
MILLSRVRGMVMQGLRESGEATNLAAETARKRKMRIWRGDEPGGGNGAETKKEKRKRKTKKEKRNSTLKTNCGNDAETNLASHLL